MFNLKNREEYEKTVLFKFRDGGIAFFSLLVEYAK